MTNPTGAAHGIPGEDERDVADAAAALAEHGESIPADRLWAEVEAAEDEEDAQLCEEALASVREGGSNQPWSAVKADLDLPGAEYGILTDFTTGEELRAATAEEHARSLAAGETGAYQDDDGRTVFVAGGPES